MPNVAGRFSGRTTVHTILCAHDIPDHELTLMEVRGLQTSGDENWNNVKMTYCGNADLIRGTGQQTGYFVNEHPNGDRDCGTFEGTLVTTNNEVTIEGTWKFTHGTGRFEGITGNGKFRGKLISPTEIEESWDGSYQLAAKTRAA